MKKLLYALAGFGFMVSSCADDYLDTMPESSTATGTIVESVENAYNNFFIYSVFLLDYLYSID